MKLVSLMVAALAAVPIASPSSAAPAFKTLYSIFSSGDGCSYGPDLSSNVFAPSQLVSFNSVLYGTTPGCGASGWGTIFSYDPSTGTETVLYSFAGGGDGEEPQAALTLVGNVFYGTTEGGGPYGPSGHKLGTVFKFDPATGAETVLHQFAAFGDGTYPAAPLLAYNGLLYGTTTSGGNSTGAGTVFSIDPVSGAEQVIYSFLDGADGANPTAGLVAYNGLLYGTTFSSSVDSGSINGGTVFSVDPVTGAEHVLHAFHGATDGYSVHAGLTLVNNQLYGATQAGGANDNGVVFRVDPATGVETILYSFPGTYDGGPVEGLLESGGLLYGSTFNPSSVFSFDPGTSTATSLYSFTGANQNFQPIAHLTLFNGLLYGSEISFSDGAVSPFLSGALFTVDPQSGAGALAHRFTGPPLAETMPGLVNLGGKLTVTSFIGGSLGLGGVFSVNPTTGIGSQLTSFPGGLAGAEPVTPVVQVNGSIYGIAEAGGANAYGAIFKIDSTGARTIVYSFTDGADGGFPAAGLTLFGGKLYGTTETGGSGNARGTLFSLDPSSGVETTLYSFTGPEGNSPDTTLVAVGNLLYGTTPGVNARQSGTIYSFNPATGATSLVYQFAAGAVQFPTTPVVSFGGALYGAAVLGNGGKYPVIYKLDLSTKTATIQYTFGGKILSISLIVVGTQLYGTTAPEFGPGSAFKFDPVSSSFTSLHTFPRGSLPNDLIGLSGSLYGTTSSGGSAGLGTVFKLKP